MTRPTREQFERLVHEHHGAVWRAAQRLCGDDAAAADVAQDVFLRVLHGKEHLEAARSERATLCWLATRLAGNRRRNDRRRRTREETAMSLRTHDEERSDPATLHADADLHATVQRLVRGLPDELRVPLQLRCEDELTLAAIGTALRLPVSTVHDRVESAMDRLRRALAARGHTLAGVALPAVLGAAGVPPGAPAGLEARLLALPGTALPVAAGLARRLALGALASTGAVALAVALARTPPSTPPAGPANAGAVGAAPRDATNEQDPPRREAAPATTVPAAAGTGVAAVPAPPAADGGVVATLTGTVRDAEAWPVGGARVTVVAGGGYKQFAVGDPATTDAHGAFTVQARSSWLQLRAVRLVVEENGRELLRSGDLAVPRPADAPPLELVLPGSVGSATSRYELAVDVRDEAGQGIAGVPVRVLAPTEPAPLPDQGTTESSATTDAGGRAVLAGRGAGTKWLFVDGRPLQRAPWFDRVAIPRGAPGTPRVVTLPRGGELALTVTTVSGRALAWSQPWLACERTGMTFAPKAGLDGVLRFVGLGDGPFTVHAHGDGRSSPVRRRAVRAGASVTLRLKERDDERDVGDHDAELHGELVDAATGAIVPFRPHAVDVKPCWHDGGSTLATDAAEPPAPAQQMESHDTFRRFHEVALGEGPHVVTASVPGYALASEVVTLRANEVRSGLRLQLVREATVRGTVRGRDGAPLRGVTLFVVGVGPLADALLEQWRAWRAARDDVMARSPSWTPLSGWTRDGGTFVLGRLPAGVPLRLVARHDEHGFVVLPLPALRAGEAADVGDVRMPGR
jgi:RNA polymerase sigma-70 factor (ECF subfamily)